MAILIARVNRFLKRNLHLFHLIVYYIIMDISKNDFLEGKIKLLQYKTGYRVTSDSVFVSSAVQAKSGETILDVGTGTGIILFCLGYRIPHLKMTGIDIQSDLLELASQNNTLNQQDIEWIQEDIATKKSLIHGRQFHHVVTNPPFYRENIIRQNKQTAMAFHQSLDLEMWIRYCIKHIRPKGTFTLIHRPEALPEILSILGKTVLGGIEIIPIHSKTTQEANRIIIRGVLGSKKQLTIHPPFITHTSENKYTNQAEDILRNGQALK